MNIPSEGTAEIFENKTVVQIEFYFVWETGRRKNNKTQRVFLFLLAPISFPRFFVAKSFIS